MPCSWQTMWDAHSPKMIVKKIPLVATLLLNADLISPEDDHDGDFLFDVGQDSHDALPDGALLDVGAAAGEHVHPEGRRRPRTVLQAAADLGLVRVFAVLKVKHTLVMKTVSVVKCRPTFMLKT